MIVATVFLSLWCLTSGHHLGPHMLPLDSPQVQSLVASNNDFAVTFYKQLAAASKKINMVASPFSVSTAIGMLYAGSRGVTAAEIENALGFAQTGLSRDDLNSAYHTLLTSQKSDQPGYDLNLANSVWLKKSLPVLDEFKNTMKDIYFADERDVEFDSVAATNLINNWVKQETKGKIPKLFDEPLDSNTAMVLINAIYFKGTWRKEFPKDETRDELFRNSDDISKAKIVPIMRLESSFGYGESPELDAQLLELPYKGNDVSMVVVLPRTGSSLVRMHDRLTSEYLESSLDKIYKKKKVNVLLPRFKTESTFELSDVLKSFGMETAFGRRANLTGISAAELAVSKVLQKALIEVNEEGSEAAAATGVQISSYSALSREEPEEIINFHATHPFMYLIRHIPTQTILFMGNVNEL